MNKPLALLVLSLPALAEMPETRAESLRPDRISSAALEISALRPADPHAFAARAFGTLLSLADRFEARFDVDLERDARLKDALAASATNSSMRPASASTALEWKPRDSLQAEFADLFAKIAAGLEAAGEADGVPATARIGESALPPAMKRRLESELLFAKLGNAWPGDSSDFQIAAGAILDLAASSGDPGERKAMVSRLARTIASLPDDPNRFEGALPDAAWIEEFREQAMAACIGDGSVSDSIVFWYRVASLCGQFAVLERQTSGILVEMNRVQDESGRTTKAERIPIFAKTFGECRRRFLNMIEDGRGAAVALKGHPYSVLVSVARDIALLGRLSDDESARLLARLDARTSRLAGARKDFHEREDERLRNGRPTGLAYKRETLAAPPADSDAAAGASPRLEDSVWPAGNVRPPADSSGPEAIVCRQWSIRPDNRPSGRFSASDNAEKWHDWLAGKGVAWPAESSIHFFPAHGILVVANTKDNLARIESILHQSASR